MLTDTNFIKVDSVFPPLSEAPRLNAIRDNRLLFEGYHSRVFKRWAKTEGVEDLSVTVNWHRRLSTMWADMLFGQEPTLSADNQDAMNDFIVNNDFINKLYESAIDISRFGVAVMKVRYDEKKGSVVDIVPADLWFPVVEAHNTKEVVKHVLAWKYKEGDNHYLKAEVHERGKVSYLTYKLTSDSIIEKLVELEEEATGVDDFLVQPIFNVGTSDSLIGNNDYNDINPIVEEIEMRLTQVSRVLDKHADPSMYGDETAIEWDEATGEYLVRGGGSFYPISQGGVAPNYLTWDANLKDCQEHIKTLQNQFHNISHTSPAIFGEIKSGMAESGSAMKRLLLTTIIKVNRLQMRYTYSVKSILAIVDTLNKRAGKESFGDVRIFFKDALPEDELESLNIQEKRKELGISDVEEIKESLDGVTNA